MKVSISAVIITLNEERNIGRCLNSLQGVVGREWWWWTPIPPTGRKTFAAPMEPASSGTRFHRPH
jgi:hypothetical protein